MTARSIGSIIALCAFLFLAQPVSAIGTERIKNFDVDMEVNSDATFTVREEITYDFGDTEHHGIERTIPYSYERSGFSYKTKLSVQSVTDESGRTLEYTTNSGLGSLTVRIGDPEAYVTGEHTYVITYGVKRAVNYFDDHDEIYWNVTGDEWNVPIDNAVMKVQLPGDVQKSSQQAACYTGYAGSTDSNCESKFTTASTVEANAKQLYEQEGLTVVVSMPKGMVYQPTALDKVKEFLADNWILLLPIIVWIIMHLLWLKKGKDPKPGTLIPQYEPPAGFDPALVGTLWDRRAGTKEASATIINLAVKGYLKISKNKSKSYTFINCNKPTQGLNPVETIIWNGIFDSNQQSVSLSSLKNKFYKDLASASKKSMELLTEMKMYEKNPTNVVTTYVIIALMLVFGIGFSAAIGLAGPVALILSIPIVLIYGILMPKKTSVGAQAKDHIAGLKWFLSVTETERLKFHNAPAKSPELFEQNLPYAMVLGVEKEWAGQFKDMFIQPTWYDDPSGGLNTVMFVSALSGMSNTMGSTMASRPSGGAGSGGSGFGGGGFSGGGFGGGGGGSW